VQVTGDVQKAAGLARARGRGGLRGCGAKLEAGYWFPVRFNIAPKDGMTRSRSRGKMKQPSTDGVQVQAGVLAS
jgi:hypothetical protein